MRYFDPLYGRIDLDEVVAEILDSCWEVRRLKHVGLMNFRSLSMHALTHATRLEHAIGTAYLAQRVALARDLNPRAARTLIAAALLHDINAGPFGHSVEWALIAKGVAEDHESASRWALKRELSSANRNRPLFLDSRPFDPDRFGLDSELFRKLHAGEPGFSFIASKHMDLDNLDNVFRMGFYLGFQDATRDPVFRLVDHLSVRPDAAYFTIPDSLLPEAIQWHDLRHQIYDLFIYDPSYLSFEAQVFELVFSLVDHAIDPLENLRLADFPDDVLLWRYFTEDSPLNVKPLIRRLIALDSYHPVYIGRVEDERLCSQLPSAAAVCEFQACVAQSLKSTLVAMGSPLPDGVPRRWQKALTNQEGLPSGIHIHVTTDKRKTHRSLLVDSTNAAGAHSSILIGEDRSYVVAALMTEAKLTRRDGDLLRLAGKQAFKAWTGREPEDRWSRDDRVRADAQLGLDFESS